MKRKQNYVDSADICELAHELTLIECKDKKIPVDKQFNRFETGYTVPAQKIFDRNYDLITRILNV